MDNEPLIQGVQLSFYMHAHAQHHGMQLSEWLLEYAKAYGIGGGSAFRATAGFGRHRVMREEQFFELTDDLPVKVELLLEQAQVEPFLQSLREHRIDMIYAVAPITFGMLRHE
jgi:PII-like signaling protein